MRGNRARNFGRGVLQMFLGNEMFRFMEQPLNNLLTSIKIPKSHGKKTKLSVAAANNLSPFLKEKIKS